YSGGLNNAARINVGLDIINTLSNHYGVQAPIFVDNAESVTKLIDVNSQVISLVVSEPDKDLRIETDVDKQSEVAEMSLEKRIYSPWAFTENEREKAKINYEIYKEIKDKAKVKWLGSGYGHKKYEVVSNPHNLSREELA